jgi:outer membrane biosynthesis protein TonB
MGKVILVHQHINNHLLCLGRRFGALAALGVLAGCGASMAASSAAPPESMPAAATAMAENSPEGVVVANVVVSPALGDAGSGTPPKVEAGPPPPPQDFDHPTKKPDDKKQKLKNIREPGAVATPPMEHAAEPQSAASPAPGAATTTSLGNAISAADVDAAIAQRMHPLRACATSDSSVSVHLSVAPGGKVADASATRSTPDDARLRDCVELALRTLFFSSSPTDRGSALSFDLELKPLGSL